MNGFIGVFRSKDVGPETQNTCVSEYIGVIASALGLFTDSNVDAIRSGYVSSVVHTTCLLTSSVECRRYKVGKCVYCCVHGVPINAVCL